MAKFLLDDRIAELHSARDWRAAGRRLAVAMGCFAAGFILAGFNEQWGFVEIIVVIGLAIWLRHHLLWATLLGLLAGYAIVATAPGNELRLAMGEAQQMYRQSLADGIRITLYQTILFVGQTLIYRFYAVLIVLLAGYTAGSGRQVQRRSEWLLGVLIGGFGLVAASLFPPSLMSGIIGYRNYTAATFVMMVCCAALGFLAACRK